MSGGHYDYVFEKIRKFGHAVYPYLEDDAGGYTHVKTRVRFARMLFELSEIAKTVEWIDSGDHGPERWAEIEAWLDEHNFE